MTAGIEELSEKELEKIRDILKSLIESLRDKKAHGLMIPDEEFILNSLTHPERGDVKVTILRDKEIEVFLSNRRDETYPFSVMSNNEVRKFSDRKFIDGVRSSLKEGHHGLFLISQQDQNRITSSANKIVSYSAFFNINEPGQNIHSDENKELKTKNIDKCTLEDKWIIYKRGWEMDNRIPVIENELFGFKVVYAKYRQKYNEEMIVFSPKKYREKVGQLVRDIYPPNVRLSLKRDFPKDHAKNVEETQKVLKSILKLIEERLENPENPEGYKSFLDELKLLLGNIVTKDPDLSGFV